MKARYLLALLVCSSGFAAVEHEVIIRLEHSADLRGGWSEVPMEAGMLTNGRLNAGRVTNEAGFYRIAGELVPVATPTPAPTPVPAPVVDVVSVAGGQLAASWDSVRWVDGFVMGRYEVTGELWDAVRAWSATRGYDLPGSSAAGPAFPAGSVSWYDAVKFCNALSEWAGLSPVYYANGAVFRSGDYGAAVSPVAVAGGNGWRLPTENEWEFAAKSGAQNQNTTYVGSNTVGAVAWYSANAASAQRIGQKSANAIGIYDMSGNVSEWCQEVATANWHPRRMRGGSYVHAELSVRLTRRSEQSPELRSAWTGFRIVRTP
jgi:formylglycine-generating enzyme required for sulfatase activity